MDKIIIKPDLYLDVDGVLLVFGETKKSEAGIIIPRKREPGKYWSGSVPNAWLFEYLRASRSHFDRAFWLSAWTSDGDTALLYKAFPQFKDLKAEGLNWNAGRKIDVIDFSRPFIWIEDGIGDWQMKEFRRRCMPGQHVWEIAPGDNHYHTRQGESNVN